MAMKLLMSFYLLLMFSVEILAQDKDEHLDNRILKEQKNVQAQEAIRVFQQIQLFEIEYTDSVRYYDMPQIKIPAQQLRNIYPNAVVEDTGFIPDIYTYPESFTYDATNQLATIKLKNDHGLVVGDKIKIIGDDRIHIGKVREIADYTTFTMELIWEPQNPFVYGRWVDDLAAVDYEAISGLHIVTTQQLLERMQNLETTLEALKVEIEALKAAGGY